MTWTQIARNHLLAAKRLCKTHPRSSVSRAYYASHVLLTEALVDAGYGVISPFETAPHRQQAILIGLYLSNYGPVFMAELSATIMRLYKSRLDADYSRLVEIGPFEGKEAIRDAVEIFALLKVEVS